MANDRWKTTEYIMTVLLIIINETLKLLFEKLKRSCKKICLKFQIPVNLENF